MVEPVIPRGPDVHGLFLADGDIGLFTAAPNTVVHCWNSSRYASRRPVFATITTDASCGAVNSMHDAFLPLGGLVALWNMMLGEVVFGGVGALTATGLWARWFPDLRKADRLE